MSPRAATQTTEEIRGQKLRPSARVRAAKIVTVSGTCGPSAVNLQRVGAARARYLNSAPYCVSPRRNPVDIVEGRVVFLAEHNLVAVHIHQHELAAIVN